MSWVNCYADLTSLFCHLYWTICGVVVFFSPLFSILIISCMTPFYLLYPLSLVIVHKYTTIYLRKILRSVFIYFWLLIHSFLQWMFITVVAVFGIFGFCFCFCIYTRIVSSLKCK